jgi:hypothetical protein
MILQILNKTRDEQLIFSTAKSIKKWNQTKGITRKCLVINYVSTVMSNILKIMFMNTRFDAVKTKKPANYEESIRTLPKNRSSIKFLHQINSSNNIKIRLNTNSNKNSHFLIISLEDNIGFLKLPLPKMNIKNIGETFIRTIYPHLPHKCIVFERLKRGYKVFQ